MGLSWAKKLLTGISRCWKTNFSTSPSETQYYNRIVVKSQFSKAGDHAFFFCPWHNYWNIWNISFISQSNHISFQSMQAGNSMPKSLLSHYESWSCLLSYLLPIAQVETCRNRNLVSCKFRHLTKRLNHKAKQKCHQDIKHTELIC